MGSRVWDWKTEGGVGKAGLLERERGYYEWQDIRYGRSMIRWFPVSLDFLQDLETRFTLHIHFIVLNLCTSEALSITERGTGKMMNILNVFRAANWE